MIKTLAISQAITDIAELVKRFPTLTLTDNPHFFRDEWLQDLPPLSDFEKASLDRIQHRCSRHRKRGFLPEGTVNQLLIAPLLTLAGLYDEPFFVTTESSLEVLIPDREELLRGRIDTLIIQEQIWVLVIEAKQSAFSTSVGIPQALAYTIARLSSEQSTTSTLYSMVTNGEDLIFLKSSNQPVLQYAESNKFSLLNRPHNELYDVLSVLKKLGRLIAGVYN